MTVQEQDTFESLLTSNDKYLSSINNIEKIEIDDNIRLEMIILFLKININTLKAITDNRNLIDIIENDEYYINGDKLCSNGEIYPILFLKELVKKIYSLVNDKRHEKVIEIDFIRIAQKRVPNITKQKKNLIEFPPSSLTKGERRYILSRLLKVNEVTDNYINDVEDEFVCNMNYMIHELLINEKNSCTYEALEFLFSIVKLYPILMYNKDEIDPTLLNILQSDIALVKATYCSDIIKYKEKKIDYYEQKKQILELRKEYMCKWRSANESRIEAIEEEIRKIELKEFMVGIDLYDVKTAKPNYNEQIIFIILKALKSHDIDLDVCVKNPTVTIFNIDEDRVENLIEIHLDTLFKMVDNKKILDSIKLKKRLAK